MMRCRFGGGGKDSQEEPLRWGRRSGGRRPNKRCAGFQNVKTISSRVQLFRSCDVPKRCKPKLLE